MSRLRWLALRLSLIAGVLISGSLIFGQSAQAQIPDPACTLQNLETPIRLRERACLSEDRQLQTAVLQPEKKKKKKWKRKKRHYKKVAKKARKYRKKVRSFFFL
ncbi:MAG: hypothetical protein AAFV26_05810 [Pseudomonadota bacterium]